MMKASEKILLYRIRANQDPEAFAQFYDNYVEKIYRFVFFKVSHKQEAEDLTSQIFFKTWNYLVQEKNKHVRSFGGLIYSIARNCIVDWYRNQAKMQECGLDQVAGIEFKIDSPLEGIQIKQETEQLLKIIKSLKQEYQEVILLRHVEGLPIADIAEIVGKKNTAVRVTLHRATKKLQELTSENNI